MVDAPKLRWQETISILAKPLQIRVTRRDGRQCFFFFAIELFCLLYRKCVKLPNDMTTIGCWRQRVKSILESDWGAFMRPAFLPISSDRHYFTRSQTNFCCSLCNLSCASFRVEFKIYIVSDHNIIILDVSIYWKEKSNRLYISLWQCKYIRILTAASLWRYGNT